MRAPTMAAAVVRRARPTPHSENDATHSANWRSNAGHHAGSGAPPGGSGRSGGVAPPPPDPQPLLPGSSGSLPVSRNRSRRTRSATEATTAAPLASAIPATSTDPELVSHAGNRRPGAAAARRAAEGFSSYVRKPAPALRVPPADHGWRSAALAPESAVPASLPPSTGRVAPVTNDAWSEQSQATAWATSRGAPMRCIGMA